MEDMVYYNGTRDAGLCSCRAGNVEVGTYEYKEKEMKRILPGRAGSS
jgi:hypothetical protein